MSEERQTHTPLAAFPRAATYDLQWMIAGSMGPNVVWLTEALSQEMTLQPQMRVLDLGCGRALSSIFLAKEFGLHVWAVDLWIGATENWQRVQSAGLEQQVFPLHADAHTLPFADGFFDALLSLDAYHYFGTDDLYLGQFARLVRPGGQIGIVVPGLKEEFAAGVPAHLQPYWEWDFCSFHSPQWWRHHWEKTGLAQVERADWLSEGWRHWLRWMEVNLEQGNPAVEREAEMLRADAGRYLGFTRLVARRK